MDSIRSLVKQFGGGVQLARKLSALTSEPVSEEAVYKWVKRETIAGRWHRPLLDLARLENVPLTAERLIELANSQKRDAAA